MKIPKTSFCSISSPEPDVPKKPSKTWLSFSNPPKKAFKTNFI